jgi:hypothetical protein
LLILKNKPFTVEHCVFGLHTRSTPIQLGPADEYLKAEKNFDFFAAADKMHQKIVKDKSGLRTWMVKLHSLVQQPKVVSI